MAQEVIVFEETMKFIPGGATVRKRERSEGDGTADEYVDADGYTVYVRVLLDLTVM